MSVDMLETVLDKYIIICNMCFCVSQEALTENLLSASAFTIKLILKSYKNSFRTWFARKK